MAQDKNASIGQLLETSAGSGSIFIPAAKAAAAAGQLGLSVPAFLVALLEPAGSYSRPAISSFPVGAVAMGFPSQPANNGFGDVFIGASFEVRSESLTVVVHGEQSAIQNAMSHAATGLQYLAISAPPCGYCRQFIWEVTDEPEEIRIILTDDSVQAGYTVYPMSKLLPVAFGPSELDKSRSLLVPQNNHIGDISADPMVQAAIDGANSCYAPYTGTFSAVALQAMDGTVAVGRYAENVAYNPSMVPMMAAFSQLNLTLPVGAPLTLKHAVLAERSSAVSMKAQSEAILAALCPGVALKVISV